MTYEEWLARADEDVHSEWVDGEVFVYKPASDRHQAVLGSLYILLSLYSWRFNLGTVRFAPFEMRLARAAREPDLLFLSREHLDRLTPQRLMGPADLVVQLISDDSVHRDRIEKFRDYEAAGVPEYWLLDPRPGKERAEFFRLTGEGAYEPAYPDSDDRYHARALSGFWLDPSWLWQEPLPNPETLLASIAPPAR